MYNTLRRQTVIPESFTSKGEDSIQNEKTEILLYTYAKDERYDGDCVDVRR